MANEGLASPSRFGSVNNAGTGFQDLFLKVFSGEVLTQFQTASAMIGRHTVRTIQSGKSAQFPVVGRASAAYHTPGQNIIQEGAASPTYLNEVPHNERVITIDDKLIAPVMISDVDEAMNHYDVRSIYAQELGSALARTMDQQLLRLIGVGAQASATVTTGNGGITVATGGADPKTVAADLITDIQEIAQTMDENDIPKTDRYLFLQPEQYYLLLTSTAAQPYINRDFVGQGSLADGSIPKVLGFDVIESIHTPNGNVNTGPSKYQYNGTNTAAVACHRSAIGTVKLRDVSVEMEWKPEYQGWLVIAKMLCGHDYLRPEACARIQDVA